jgi:hypothetical protein
MWYITLDSYFLLFILHILLFNRCVVINHTNICLDLFFRKSIFHVLIPKKILPKFWPNFTKFDNFGGGRNFCNTEIKNLGALCSAPKNARTMCNLSPLLHWQDFISAQDQCYGMWVPLQFVQYPIYF